MRAPKTPGDQATPARPRREHLPWRIAWYDDFELAVETRDGTWRAVPLSDPGFEARDLFAGWNRGTGRTATTQLPGWKVTLDESQPASGRASLRIEAETKTVRDELFADAPSAEEVSEIELGRGLRARVPLTLPSRDGRTVGDDPARAEQELGAPLMTGGFDPDIGIADVLVTWNVFQHFWPYWDTVSADWNHALDVSVSDALDDRTIDEHVVTLKRLSALVPDGHSSVACPGARTATPLPFTMRVIENEVVVTSTAVPAVNVGDLARSTIDRW